MPINFAGSTFVVKKGLPYTVFLNYHISRLRNSGTLQQILRKHDPKEPTCISEEKTKSIHIQKVIFPFTIFWIGLLLSLAILLIENKTNNKLIPEITPLLAVKNFFKSRIDGYKTTESNCVLEPPENRHFTT